MQPRDCRATALPTAPADPAPRGGGGRIGRPLPREVIRDGKWEPFSPIPAVELFCRLDPGARVRFSVVTARRVLGPWDEGHWPDGSSAIVIDTPGETVRTIDFAFRGTGPYTHYAIAANVQGNGECGATYILTAEQAAEIAAQEP
jgi:hypothetical protein